MTLKRLVAWIKRDWEITKEDISQLLSWVIGGSLWLLVGFILTAFYAFLTGGIHGEILGTWSVFVSPAIVFILALFFIASRWNGEEFPWIKKVFWIVLVWAFLPVMFNGTSIVLKWVGIRGIGEIIFKARFDSLWLVPMAGAIVAGLTCWIRVRNKRRKQTVLT